jgi:hypothetical protein
VIVASVAIANAATSDRKVHEPGTCTSRLESARHSAA